jgi:hypothetical protein
VIGAGNLDRPQHTLKAKLFEAHLIEIEILESPADLFSCQGPPAEFLSTYETRLRDGGEWQLPFSGRFARSSRLRCKRQ